MRITVDTNILVSATFWKGSSDRIIQKAEKKEIELILSKEILEEYAGVLDYKEIKDKIKNKSLEMSRTVEKVTAISTIIAPKERFDIVKDDPDDNKILECAHAGNVKYIISNDKHLLKIKEFKGIKIISSDEFISIKQK